MEEMASYPEGRSWCLTLIQKPVYWKRGKSIVLDKYLRSGMFFMPVISLEAVRHEIRRLAYPSF
ncbi:MAG: hypothetical protein D6755_02225, partial [Anaerolineae bacterium]